MPGDPPFLNTKGKQQHNYDAIVVGSGISGGWAAKELCERGLKVLMIERGRELIHGDYPTATKDPWDFPHRLTVTPEEKKQNFVQSRHYSFREDNKHFYINDQENPYEETKRFDWIRGDIVGGRSLLWARACYRWSDIDFEANARDGHGIDWPIRYKEIAPWYDYVEKFVGISGNRDGVDVIPDGIFQPAFEMNCVETDFRKKIESRFPERRVIMGRTANLINPLKGRGSCQARDLCHRGCPYGAYFSSNSATIPAAIATGNLTLRANAIVTRVIYDEQRQKAIGVEIVDSKTKEVQEFYARILFLNASTVATAAILLHSTSSRFPNGLGNGSDQVGRNLMDHHKGLSFAAEVEGFEDSYYYGRRPTALYIPRFRNVHDKHPGFLRGYQFGGSASRPPKAGNASIGEELKSVMSEPGPWQFGLWGFGECLPYADNRVTLSKTKQDQWGRQLVVVDCSFRENENAMHGDMAVTGLELLEAAGYRNPLVRGSISFPGNANHEMGIARMGHDPRTSVLNKFNQMHEVSNVFITDGSCMTSSSCLNPSLTYMALTARACAYAVGELKRGNI
jgi:choline dehydrogenase-like flavoprotein